MIINGIDVLNVTEKGGKNMLIFLSHLLPMFIGNGAALSDFIPPGQLNYLSKIWQNDEHFL